MSEEASLQPVLISQSETKLCNITHLHPDLLVSASLTWHLLQRFTSTWTYFSGPFVDPNTNVRCWKLWEAVLTPLPGNIPDTYCWVCFTPFSLRPLSVKYVLLHPWRPSLSSPKGPPCNLIHAAVHNTLHGTQSQWYRAPLFHSLHLSFLFLCSLFILPLYAWVIPNWAHNWNGNHSCFPVT